MISFLGISINLFKMTPLLNSPKEMASTILKSCTFIYMKTNIHSCYKNVKQFP